MVDAKVRNCWNNSRKKTVFERSFFYPIRRIGMESPAGCMESVAKRRHGITRQRVFLLRIDYIQHFVLIPYRRQAADFIHAYRRDYIESYVKVLDFGGLFAFLGIKTTPLSPVHLCSHLLVLKARFDIGKNVIDF